MDIFCHFPHGKKEFVIYCKEQDTSCIKTSWLKMIWHARYFPLLSSTKADSEGHLYGWLWDRLMEAHKHLLLMSQLSTENKKRIYRRLRTMYMSIRAINSKIQYESVSCSWLHPSLWYLIHLDMKSLLVLLITGSIKWPFYL